MAESKPERSGDVRVGCAGWSLPKEHGVRFPAEGTHLARYAARFPAVEINSSFYRPHRPATYARWAGSVPTDFLFSVKVPKVVTHEHRLVDVNAALDSFLSEATRLGDRLGPLLVQLPPTLAFSASIAESFFAELRDRFGGDVALEPRHASWFTPAADRLARQYRVARVAADPAVVPAAAEPGGWDGLLYYRLHGSPKIYHSAYPKEYLEALAKELTRAARSAAVWCIFDNTAEGAATVDALGVLDRVGADLTS
ncbi:MAG TPA: DUF72 domain-containing protein [Solirubrobacterales bacterium]|nr:DUF72 domain-containing protein [Solirubrobacterales bacterium]